ncbi:MAG: metallophosphoesterase [Acidimicrobiia bacterium]|nr:metallophosphoesterase [Acidimicrobiia bacterium]
MADDEAVIHDGTTVRRYPDLEPDRPYEYDGFAFRTLPVRGERLATFATVNDVHFGETECGIMEGFDMGPVFTVPHGEEPHPDFMNRGAIEEIAAADVDAVVVKGDLTSIGTRDEYQAFLDAYEPAFGDRLHHVRGNHDAYHGENYADDAPFSVALPGVLLAVIDTTIPRETPGRVTDETLEWLGDLASSADRPVLVFGHHHVWSPESKTRPDGYFGINPDDSEKLVELFASQSRLAGYFAGHTHRNRVRRFSLTGRVPWVEVACVKDYPGSWAEYRVFEGGITQIHRRISTEKALEWTEKTREMFGGLYQDYAFGDLEDRCFEI